MINYKWNKRDVLNYRFLIPILEGSNTLNNTGVWSLIELASLYTVPLSAVNGLSRLTTTSNGQTRPIRKFSNRPTTVESNRDGRFEFESNIEASQVPTVEEGDWYRRTVEDDVAGLVVVELIVEYDDFADVEHLARERAAEHSQLSVLHLDRVNGQLAGAPAHRPHAGRRVAD